MNAALKIEDSSVGFEDSCFLPSQFRDLHRRPTLAEAERKLLLAVLRDAIFCYLKYRGRRVAAQKRILFAEAKYWIFSASRLGPFSFLNLCEVLGIDPYALRSALKRMETPVLAPN